MNVPYSDKLAKKLLDINLNLNIGSLGMIEKNGSSTVILKAVLIPEFISKKELIVYVANIAKAADDLDDIIVDEFGGEKLMEFLERREKELKEGKKIIN